MTFLIQVDRKHEVVDTIRRAVHQRNISDAVITLIGAVSEAEISVMAKDNEKIDYIRRYHQPLELSGTGEVVDGDVHLHVTLAGEDITVAGHLHRATVGGFFVRAYITPVASRMR